METKMKIFLAAAIASLAFTAVPAKAAPDVEFGFGGGGFELRINPDDRRRYRRGYESCRRHWHGGWGHRHCIWVRRNERRAWRRHENRGH